MMNPKTSLAGWALLALAAVTTIYRVFWLGQAPDFMALFNLLTGLGLIAAQDGGH